MAHIGLTGAGQKPARSPTSVRAIAPCQIPPLRPPDSSPLATGSSASQDTLTLKRQCHTEGTHGITGDAATQRALARVQYLGCLDDG